MAEAIHHDGGRKKWPNYFGDNLSTDALRNIFFWRIIYQNSSYKSSSNIYQFFAVLKKNIENFRSPDSIFFAVLDMNGYI